MHSLRRRVVVTGMGTVNPLGNCLEDTWRNLCAGISGVGPITRFDTTGFTTKIAGEVKNFDPLAFINAKELRRLDNFIIYALAAAEMARADAQLIIDEKNADRTGVIMGSAIGGLATIEKEKETVLTAGPRKMSPFAIPSVLANLAPGNVAIRMGARGPISCVVTACAAGNNAISDAARLIAFGYADAMFTGGTDAAVCSLAVAGFNSMRAISVRNDEPEKASRPFDADRDGFVISEGCAVLILEEMTSAMARGARIYAEVAGSGFTCDAFHIAAPPSGASRRRALHGAGPRGCRHGTGRRRLHQRPRHVDAPERRLRDGGDKDRIREPYTIRCGEFHEIDDGTPAGSGRRHRGHRSRKGNRRGHHSPHNQPGHPRSTVRSRLYAPQCGAKGCKGCHVELIRIRGSEFGYDI